MIVLIEVLREPATSGVGVFRQEIHFVLSRKTNDFSDVRKIVQMLKQRFQLAGWRNPEQRLDRLVRFVEVAVGNSARHAHEVAGLRLRPDPIQLQVERAFLDQDEFVLGGMDMDGDKLPRLCIGLEREGRVADGLGKINLTENVPGCTCKSFPFRVMPFSSAAMMSCCLTVAASIGRSRRGVYPINDLATRGTRLLQRKMVGRPNGGRLA